MVHGGNTDNVNNRRRVIAARRADGDCTICHPHGGENFRRGDRRWISSGNNESAILVRRKPKEKK